MILVILAVAIIGSQANNHVGEWSTIVEKESSFRRKINMTYDHYHAYPFPIKHQQQFVLSFPQTQKVTGEIFVYLIGQNSSLIEPSSDSYDNELMTLKIKRENQLNIFQDKFYTQSGFRFTAEGGKQYRLTFNNLGKKTKMVEFAISYLIPDIVHNLPDSSKFGFNIDSFSQQLKGILQHWEQDQSIRESSQEYSADKFNHYMMCSLWEMVVIGVLMGIQLFVFKKMTNDCSII